MAPVWKLQYRMQSGEKIKIGDGLSYDEVAAEGEHLATRKRDIDNGKEVVYYFVPVEKHLAV